MSASCPYLYVMGMRVRACDLSITASQLMNEVERRMEDGRAVPPRLRRMAENGELQRMAAEARSLRLSYTREEGGSIYPEEFRDLFSDRPASWQPLLNLRTEAGEIPLPVDPTRMRGRAGRESYGADPSISLRADSPWVRTMRERNSEALACIARMQLETAPKSDRNAGECVERISDAATLLHALGGEKELRSSLRKNPRSVGFLSGATVTHLAEEDPEGMLKVARMVAEHSFWFAERAPEEWAKDPRSVFDPRGASPDAAPMLIARLIASGEYRDEKRSGEIHGLFLRAAREVNPESAPMELALAMLLAFPAATPERAAADTFIREMSEERDRFRASYTRAQAWELERFRELCRRSPGAADRVMAALATTAIGSSDAADILRPEHGLGSVAAIKSTRRPDADGYGGPVAVSSPALIALAVHASKLRIPGGGEHADSTDAVAIPTPHTIELILQAARKREDDLFGAFGDDPVPLPERDDEPADGSRPRWYATWDPRPGADNSRVLEQAAGRGGGVYAIEGTDRRLTEIAKVNLDPQHGNGSTDHPAGMAAIEAALTAELPDDDDVLTTPRPDLDSVGAMAVILLRKAGLPIGPETLTRIRQVAEADAAADGEWPGEVEAPAPADLVSPLSGMAAVVSDFRVSLGKRTQRMAEWLHFGYGHGAADQHRSAVAAASQALAESQVTVSAHGEDGARRVAKVVSRHRLAPKVGYTKAPVVMSLNDSFSIQGGEIHRKWTISKYSDTVRLDMVKLRDELNTLEAAHGGEGTWGGTASILGSPQGASSAIPDAQIEAAVARAVASD